jgi:hypothetical protein
MKIRMTIPKLKTITITFLSIAIVGSLSGAAYFVPKYLKEQQKIRDESRDCVRYRDFLLAYFAWEQEGDTDQAQGVYALAIHHFKKGQCTQIHGH